MLQGGHERLTDRQTDRRTDRQTDRQAESDIPPPNFVAGGIKMMAIRQIYRVNPEKYALGPQFVVQDCDQVPTDVTDTFPCINH